MWRDLGRYVERSGAICGEIWGESMERSGVNYENLYLLFIGEKWYPFPFAMEPRMSLSKMKDLVVYQANSLTEAQYRLTVQEKRILLCCIAQVRHDRPITDEILYTVSAADIASGAKSKSHTIYKDLKEAALRLRKRDVRLVKTFNSDGTHKEVMVAGWVQTVTYVENEGTIRLRLNKDMLPYLTSLEKEFTKFKVKNILQMKSFPAMRLYELLMQWNGIGQREVRIVWLREIFMLEGRYPAIADLKKWVIEPAIKQINKYSELSVKHEYIKTGRRISHINLKFKNKKIKKSGAPPNLELFPDKWAAYRKAAQNKDDQNIDEKLNVKG